MKKMLLLLPVLCVLLYSCGKEEVYVEKPVYIDRVDTVTITVDSIIHDTIKINVPEYVYIHDTAYIFKTDTLYMSQDGRQIADSMYTYINNNWFYIRDRMNTSFNTDGATRIYVYISRYIFHMNLTNSNDMVVLISTKDGVLNSVTYFGVDKIISPSQNPYGWKYVFPASISGLNPLFFDSPLVGVFTSTPGYFPFP